MDELDDIQRFPRLSFSTISDTTVNSSLVNRLVIENSSTMTNNFSIDNFVRDLNGAVQSNFKIEGSSGIRVGDAIYNFYYPPPTEETSERIPKQSLKEKFQNFKFTRLRIFIIISVALFAITAGLLLYFLIPTNDQFPDTTEGSTETSASSDSTTPSALEYDFIVPRSEWTFDSLDANIKPLTSFPIRRIIVGQTDDAESCFNRNDCIAKIIEIRNKTLDLLDIPWNFLIGADGNVYEGRGNRHEGEHTINVNGSDYNDIGIGIGFIGNFRELQPPDAMTNIFETFCSKSVKDGFFSADYKIFFQDQLIYKELEAINLGNFLKNMTNFYEIQKIYKREEWGASNSAAQLAKMINPLERVILHHTETSPVCHNKQNCTEILKILQKNAMITYGYDDINYNFIIGGSEDFAMVLEGRGFTNRGAHTLQNNAGSLGIGLIGHFQQYSAGPAMMTALQDFINDSVALGKLKADYLLHTKRHYDGSISPGDYVIDIVKEWPRFSEP